MVTAALEQAAAAASMLANLNPASCLSSRMVFDETLEHPFRLDIEFGPTLIRVEAGRERVRTYGWHRGDRQRSCSTPWRSGAKSSSRAAS